MVLGSLTELLLVVLLQGGGRGEVGGVRGGVGRWEKNSLEGGGGGGGGGKLGGLSGYEARAPSFQCLTIQTLSLKPYSLLKPQALNPKP